MDDYTLSMAEAINEHQGNADADHSVNVSMADAINEYQDRFSADTEGVTEHQATIPADTNHSPGAKIVFASADASKSTFPIFPTYGKCGNRSEPTLFHFVPLFQGWNKWNRWNKAGGYTSVIAIALAGDCFLLFCYNLL